MKVTSNMAAPSFTAKLKNNELTTGFVKRMDKNQLDCFKAALTQLDKVHPDDVVELKSRRYEGGKSGGGILYSLVNTKTNNAYSFNCTESKELWNPNNFINAIVSLGTNGTDIHNRVLGDEEKTKRQNEIFDMMA